MLETLPGSGIEKVRPLGVVMEGLLVLKSFWNGVGRGRGEGVPGMAARMTPTPPIESIAYTGSPAGMIVLEPRRRNRDDC